MSGCSTSYAVFIIFSRGWGSDTNNKLSLCSELFPEPSSAHPFPSTYEQCGDDGGRSLPYPFVLCFVGPPGARRPAFRFVLGLPLGAPKPNETRRAGFVVFCVLRTHNETAV